MRVFAYPRVSTDDQAKEGNSLSEQQERLTAYCRAMGWDEPEWYIDDGYSAKDIRRPELTRMLDDIKASKSPGIVITTKLDRLSRNLFDILSLIKYFEKYEFNYVSSTEAFDTSTAAGRLTLQVLGMVAEFERERNSERVRDNMLSLARKINEDKTITRPCFGYDVIDGVITVNIEEALITRRMADMAVKGAGARAIAKWLNAEKIKTKEGNEWHDKVVREYLQRETLIGQFVYNKTYRKGSRVIKRLEEDWIVVENHHEPILDEDTFHRMCQLFQGRKTIGRYMQDDRYLLSGLIWCGHCGHKMNGKMNKNFSKRLNQQNIHYQYLCDGYLKKGICSHHYISRDVLENLVIARIKQIAEAAPGTIQVAVAAPKTTTLEKEAIQAKLDKLDHRLQKQIEAYEDDIISADDLRKAKQRVEDERKRLLQALKEAEEGTDSHAQKKVHENAKRWAAEISEDRLKTKHILREAIHKIEITNGENVELTWNV